MMNLSPATELSLSIGTLCSVLVFFGALVVKYTNFKDKVESKIENIQKEIDEYKAKVEVICDKVQNTEIVLAEIRTKLASIESILLEFKKDLYQRKA